MDPNIQWHNETLGKKVVAMLEKNRFKASYFSDRESAVAYLLDLVPDGSSVGLGGSETSYALKLREKLSQKSCTLLDHHKPGLSKEEVLAVRRKQLTSNVFICSTNALTLDGELVNVDGVGNRVSAMIFGPEKVIIVTGTNKIVENLDAAQKRIEQIAAPVNNKRLNRPNPCVTTGQCMDCRSEYRICNITTIMRCCPSLTDVHVLIIGEDLGY